MGVHKESTADLILKLLENTVDGWVQFDDFAKNSHLYASYGRNPLPKSALSQAINRLRETGAIEQSKDNSGKLIIKLLKPRVLKVNKKNWDGVWRVIIFDIPEQKRTVRNLFRRNLKNWGFQNLQKSVWITKIDCFDELKRIIKDLDIERWVTILETKSIYPNP